MPNSNMIHEDLLSKAEVQSIQNYLGLMEDQTNFGISTQMELLPMKNTSYYCSESTQIKSFEQELTSQNTRPKDRVSLFSFGGLSIIKKQ